MLILYKEKLFNPQWGEQMYFNPDRSARVSMLFHGLTQNAAKGIWQEFLDWINAHPSDYSMEQALTFVVLPARQMWSPAFLKTFAPDFVTTDNRAGSPENNIFWKGNQGEAGEFLYAYHSAWIPKSYLEADQMKNLVEAVFY